MSVVLPDGGQILCSTLSNIQCTDYYSATYTCAQQPTGGWFNSTIAYDPNVPGGGGWDLTRKDGTVYKFGFAAPLQSINDRYGNSITLTRTGTGGAQRGNVTYIAASNERSLELYYGGSPNNCCITGFGASGGGDAAGRNIQYSYNSNSQLHQVTYPNISSNASITYTWNSIYTTLISLIGVNINKPSGTVVTDFVNPQYNLSSTTLRLSSVYPGQNGDPGRGVQYSYNLNNGQITGLTATFSDGSTRELSVNAAGYITQDIRDSGESGKKETFNYTRDFVTNQITEVQQAEDPEGRYTELTYDADGNVTSETLADSSGDSVTNSYAYDYTKFDQLKQFTNGIGKIWSIGLDSLGNPISVTDPLQRTWSAAYNAAGLITSITDPAAATNSPPYNGPLQTFFYNSADDLQSLTQRASDSETTTYQTDAVGRVTSVTSPLGETQSVIYDNKDEITSVTDANGFTTAYAYNWNGDLAALTDANQNVTTWNWTPPNTESSWNVKECDPSRNCATYLIESMGGLLDQYTDKRGVVDKFDYDNLGRESAAHYDVNGQLGGTVNDTFAYDRADREIGVTHANSGTPCSASDGNNHTDSFGYDFMDDVLTNCTPEGTITNTFDGIGRRKSMAAGSQMTNNYTWDDANDLSALSSLASVSLTYTPDGQRQTLAVNNGTNVTTGYSYDPASERLSQLTYASTQNPSLGTLAYSYDADGRVIGKSGYFATLALPAASSTTAAYAPTNQVQTWINGNTPNVDPNNSLKTDPASGLSYSWNAKDELLTAGTDSYNYDAGGRRESVSTAGGTVTYLYDGTTPVQIMAPPSGATDLTAMPDSNDIFSVGGGSVLLHDALGSTIGGVGANGTLAFQYSYDPFGNFTASGTPPSGYGNVYGMAGIEYDPSGLYHANARYYSPALTRFISEDPERGKSNMFTYAGENAISGSDLSGMDGCPLGDCGGGMGGGGQGGGGGGGFFEVLSFFLNTLFNSFLTQSSATQPIANFGGPQLKAQFGASFWTLGMAGNANVYTTGGGIMLVQVEEDEEPEPYDGTPRTLEGKGERDIAEHTSQVIVRAFLKEAMHAETNRAEQFSKSGGFPQANADFDSITGEWGLGVNNQGEGVRSTRLPNGGTASVRPNSTGGSPTIQINMPGQTPIKIRY